MVIDMDEARVRTMEQLRRVLAGGTGVPAAPERHQPRPSHTAGQRLSLGQEIDRAVDRIDREQADLPQVDRRELASAKIRYSA